MYCSCYWNPISIRQWLHKRVDSFSGYFLAVNYILTRVVPTHQDNFYSDIPNESILKSRAHYWMGKYCLCTHVSQCCMIYGTSYVIYTKYQWRLPVRFRYFRCIFRLFLSYIHQHLCRINMMFPIVRLLC